jgi:hypothetical protein
MKGSNYLLLFFFLLSQEQIEEEERNRASGCAAALGRITKSTVLDEGDQGSSFSAD